MQRRFAPVFALAAVAIAFGCTKAPSDAAMAESIKAQMFSDQQLKNSNLNITVNQGVATISGDVSDDSARLEAYKLAAQTAGIKKVDDQMSVETPQATLIPPPPPEPAPIPAAKAKPKPSKADRKAKRRAMEAAYSEPSPQSPDQPPPSSTDEQPPQPAPDAPLATPADTTQTPPPAPVAAPAPQPKDVEIASGTTIRVRMIDRVDSEVNRTGEVFHASLEAPILVNNEVAVPKGADVYVRLASAKSAGHMAGRSELHLELVKLDYAGRSYSLVSSTSSVVGSSRGKKTATAVGAGAVIGGIIGAIAGGGKGAAIGATVGGAGGGVYQASTKGEQVKVPAETVLDFQLEQPATVTVPPRVSSSGN